MKLKGPQRSIGAGEPGERCAPGPVGFLRGIGSPLLHKMAGFYGLSIQDFVEEDKPPERTVELIEELYKADFVVFDGELIDVRDEGVAWRIETAIRMGMTWAKALWRNGRKEGRNLKSSGKSGGENRISVFVYGTLLIGEPNHQVAAPYLISVRPGRVRGRLYDVGAYPALVLDPEGREIDGEWFEVIRDGLKAMDRLEDYRGPGQANDYERVWVWDAREERCGWVYVWPDSRGYPEIPIGSWREWRVRGRRVWSDI